ncbi:hypothetical protein RCO28_02585 [Streptomyces sp. LHD-70]|uniref:hypothetical protein n=1 Tax=Streptomyces sp. LHD-70 TaxID=3072140 RepID=UPI00280E6A22|nr:hypothetical protein [Streptomyces sp. LHD-70]MDQ8701376.1 hypothetical protein [Streptomyces sp. LHD-70]
MSAHDIPFNGLFAAFVLTVIVAWTVGHRRRGIPSIATGLLAMQAGLHLTFAGSQGHGSQAYASHGSGLHASTGTGPHAGHGSATYMSAGTHLGHDAPMSGSGAGAHGAATDHSSLGMLAVHVLAALVCALWLARGEAAFLQLLAAVDSLAFAPLRLLLTAVRLPLPPRITRRPRPRPAARARAAVLAYAVTRRGPPATAPLLRHAPLAS